MEKNNKKSRVALLSVSSNTILVILKIAAGIMSGSISIISEAIHSGMDLIAALIAFLAVRAASKPADREHPYGHGKLENASGLAEGALIFIAAGMIIFESAKKLLHPASLEQTGLAVAVMLIAGIINFFVSRVLYKTAKEEDSQALEADALHLKTDVYTSLAVGAGVLLVKLTGIGILDPLVAMGVALLIIKEAWNLLRGAMNYLTDVKLSDEEERQIVQIIESHQDSYLNYHKLKTRKAGNMRHIDFHITEPENMTVGEAHKIIGMMKKDMCEKLQNTRVSIHVDPQESDAEKKE
jgi:cation diffusion facilitator family transporter